jgi:hypothetical protein
VKLHHLTRRRGVYPFQRTLDVAEELGVIIYAVILQILVQRLNVVVDKTGRYLADLQELFNECGDPVIQPDGVVIFMDDFVGDQFFELVVRHVVSGEDLRFVYRVFAAEQQLDNVSVLIQQVNEVSYGQGMLQKCQT